MEIKTALSDQAILEEVGRRLARRRLALRLSQAELAEQAGVGKRTVERIEAGEPSQLTSLMRIFRVLDLLPALDATIPADTVRPMALLKLGGKQPVRRVRKRDEESRVDEDQPWSWGETE
jgi:transcriptional regulator with XRE-family HTH domain